jgi:hypothetical protein
MEEYSFESFFKEENLTKKYYKEFKKFHKKNETSEGNEYWFIKLVESMKKTRLEPIVSATFIRNLVRSREAIKRSENPEEYVLKWYKDIDLKFTKGIK